MNGKYVDMATQAKERQKHHGGTAPGVKSLQEKIPEVKKSQARDEAGKAAGIISEQSKKNMIHSETRRITTNFPKVPLTRV